MNNTKIIHLRETRELLAELNEIRVAILAGRIEGFHAGFRGLNGEETLYLGGVFREEPMQAVPVLMRAAAEGVAPTEGQPLVFRSSQM